MSDDQTTVYKTAIEAALANLAGRTPELRGARQQLAPYIEQIRKLLSRGLTRREIIGELKICGFPVSPTLLRDLLGEGTPQKVTNTKTRKTAPVTAVDPPTPELHSAYLEQAEQ